MERHELECELWRSLRDRIIVAGDLPEVQRREIEEAVYRKAAEIIMRKKTGR